MGIQRKTPHFTMRDFTCQDEGSCNHNPGNQEAFATQREE